MAVRTHEREEFYKFSTADRAIQILDTLQVGWPSPLLFNDPFDTQFELRFGCAGQELAEALAPEIERLVFSDDELPSAMHPFIANVLRVVRPLRAGADPRQVIQAARPGIYEGVKNASAMLETYDDHWRRWLREMRVFCVSEINDDILMWSHYADCHRGVVIELKCIPEKASALCSARPVRYQPDIPVLGTRDEWVKHIIGERPIDLDDLFAWHAFTKSSHWSYEKEWRCWVGHADPTRDVVELVGLNKLCPEEVSAVYLGCRISPKHCETIKSLAARRVPHARILQARQSRTEFKLEFELLK